jgi:iron complex outermembrane receptor protein
MSVIHRCVVAIVSAAAVGAAPSCARAADAPVALEEIVVTATLRPLPWLQTPASVAVLDARELRDGGRDHFQDVLALVPNLNWSGGSSRPRYLQVRGIGELEQYQGAPNPSVGVLIDGMDFSGIGMAATTYGIERIEVLRGPQGTRYGANALAGLVNVTSLAPAARVGGAAELGGGGRGYRQFAATLTGPASFADSAWRVTAARTESDGFQRNAFLGRDDTNGREETTLRARWRASPTDTLDIDVSLLRADLDNGYDAFALDNSRTTLSDRPGRDSQRATGGALRLDWRGLSFADATLLASLVDSASRHAYDGDWGNARSWAPFTYDFTYDARRDRRHRSLEFRLASRDGAAGVAWLLGLYAFDIDERIRERSAGLYVDDVVYDFTLAADDTLDSRYSATSLAAFGELAGRLGDRWRWSFGARAERRDADYVDRTAAFGVPAGSQSFAPGDTMWGGNLSLTREFGADASVYLAVARGYKAGGFNIGLAVPELRRTFRPESLLNFELGWRAALLGGRLRAEATAFHMRRRALQVRTSVQLVPGDPNTFVFFTDNAARGTSTGLEASLRLRATETLEFGAGLGLLRARLQDYAPGGVQLAARDAPHAPRLQYAVNATWRHPAGVFARIDVTGTGRYYFEVPPADARTGAHALAHVKLGFERGHWSVSLWARNVFDRRHAVRGFFFGNEPPDFPPKLYTQLGDGRQVGATAAIRFE